MNKGKTTGKEQSIFAKKYVMWVSISLAIMVALIIGFIAIFANKRNAEAILSPGAYYCYTYFQTNITDGGHVIVRGYWEDTVTTFPNLYETIRGGVGEMWEVEAVPNEGYRFDKWTYTTKQNTSGKVVINSETETSTSQIMSYAGYANITVYWKTEEVTINFDQQSGTGGVGSVTASPDEAMPTLTSLPSRTGYTFGGYYTAPNGGGTRYYNSSGVSTHNCDLSEGTTLYAKWTANTYTVVYNSNKPSNASSAISGTMSNVTHTYDTAKNLTANAYSLTGWTFKGWAISSGGSVVYNDKASVKNLANSGTYNLYAVWQPNTYTINYNSNKPSNASTSISGMTANSVHTYDISKALTKNGYSLPGYTFLGWATSASGDVVLDDSATIRNLTETNGAVFNLYAKWTANTYYIKYNANGATSGTMANSVHTFDTSKALSDNKYTWANHRFLGWATSSTATTPAYQNGQAIINLTTTAGNTINLYAVWVLFWTVNIQNDDNLGNVLIISNDMVLTETEFQPGQIVDFYAVANANSAFVKWIVTGANITETQSITNPLRLTINSNITITPVFQDNLVAGVAITSTLGGTAKIVGDNFENLADDDAITLVADVCLDGYRFSHWENLAGDNLGSDNSIRLSKSQIINNVITAVFVEENNITNESVNIDKNN